MMDMLSAQELFDRCLRPGAGKEGERALEEYLRRQSNAVWSEADERWLDGLLGPRPASLVPVEEARLRLRAWVKERIRATWEVWQRNRSPTLEQFLADNRLLVNELDAQRKTTEYRGFPDRDFYLEAAEALREFLAEFPTVSNAHGDTIRVPEGRPGSVFHWLHGSGEAAARLAGWRAVHALGQEIYDVFLLEQLAGRDKREIERFLDRSAPVVQAQLQYAHGAFTTAICP